MTEKETLRKILINETFFFIFMEAKCYIEDIHLIHIIVLVLWFSGFI